MSEALPLALHERIVAAYDRGGLEYKNVAELFGVSEAAVSRLLSRARRTGGDLRPDPHGGGNPPRIPGEQFDALRALVIDMHDATRVELCEQWKLLHGGFATRESREKKPVTRHGARACSARKAFVA